MPLTTEIMRTIPFLIGLPLLRLLALVRYGQPTMQPTTLLLLPQQLLDGSHGGSIVGKQSRRHSEFIFYFITHTCEELTRKPAAQSISTHQNLLIPGNDINFKPNHNLTHFLLLKEMSVLNIFILMVLT